MITKLPKRRYCRICKTGFKPENHWHWWCCDEHKVEVGVLNLVRHRERAAKAAKTRLLKAERDRKDKLKVRKAALKTARELKPVAQEVFNKYVRLRDHGKRCISCGSLPVQKLGGTMDCGHFRSVGSSAHLRFNLLNAHAQCVHCNRDLDGNVLEYEKGLILRIGAEKVEALKSDYTIRRFDKAYLERFIVIFRRKTRRLEKRIKNRGDQ